MIKTYAPILICLLSALSATSAEISLKLVKSGNYDVIVKRSTDAVIEIITTGNDPQVVFESIEAKSLELENHILAFEYFCPDGIDFVEVFYAKNAAESWSQTRQLEGDDLPKAEAWQPYAIDLKLRSKGKWTPKDTLIRLDFGRQSGSKLQVRNFQLRAPTEIERLGSEAVEAKLEAKKDVAQKIEQYLEQKVIQGEVNQVTVSKETISVTGEISKKLDGPFYLVEYTPHSNPWSLHGGTILDQYELEHTFEVTLPRFKNHRDRIANRFAITTKIDQKALLISRAVWASDVADAAERDMPRMIPANKKGLGGVSTKEGIFEEDLSDLGITASTVNFSLSGIVQAGKNPILFEHQGKTWKYNRAEIKKYDKKLKWMTDTDIVISAILLVDKNAGILVHPEYNTAGIYSMGNFTSEASCDAYRAVISFLAERYSRPNKEHGWINHWIIFNEVDYGWIWTNMGEQPMAIYMDAYNKAMRLTWLEARRFNPTAEVFVSLTHHWQYSPADQFRAYPPRTVLDRLALYSKQVGNYHWGVAYHPYPQSLLKPRTWEDTMAPARFDARFITPKNIEVLDAYLHQEQFLYEGNTRTVILSEQGFHTPDYSTKSMQNKAAAIAYTWEKILPLKTVESFHYHRWVDHPMEGGLKVGLRTLPDDQNEYGVRKEPAFTLFSKLETQEHEAAIIPYKKVVGIDNWDEVHISAEDIKR